MSYFVITDILIKIGRKNSHFCSRQANNLWAFGGAYAAVFARPLGGGGMMRGLAQTELLRLTRGMYAMAVKKGNWGRLNLISLYFFNNQWILGNLPHKDPCRNKVNVTKSKVTNEYKPVEMCKYVFWLLITISNV